MSLREKFYSNISERIKMVALVYFWIGAIATVIIGISMMSLANDIDEIGWVLGFITFFIGPVSSWLGSLFVYAFGVIVEKIIAISKK